jgi:DNA-binding response OmpR family regulator
MSPILLIGGDLPRAAILAEYLEREGLSAHIESDVRRGIAKANSGGYVMAIVDDARALQGIRARSELPVLVTTGANDGTGALDCVAALELGADAVVEKPCTPRELCARIRAILRRMQATPAGSPRNLVCGGLILWPEQRRAEWRGEPLPLTSTEFSLLETLLRHAGQPVSKRDLSLVALGRSFTKHDRRVDVHVSSIRRKLCAVMNGRSWIRAVQGQGYRLQGE